MINDKKADCNEIKLVLTLIKNIGITESENSIAVYFASNSKFILMLCAYLSLDCNISIKQEVLSVLMVFSETDKSEEIWTIIQSNDVFNLLFNANMFDNEADLKVYSFFEITIEFLEKMPRRNLQQSNVFIILKKYFVLVVESIVQKTVKM